MTSPEEFREIAAKCERQAEEAVQPRDREIMLFAATRWRQMADEEEARRKIRQANAMASVLRDWRG
jgi:hypothetical protein